MIWLRSEFDADGNRVHVYRSNEHKQDTCAYCVEANCEQEVHQCDAWDGDVIVHDRPKVMN